MRHLESNFPALTIQRIDNQFRNAEDYLYKTEYFRSWEIIESIMYSECEFVHVHEVCVFSTRHAHEFERYCYSLMYEAGISTLINSKKILSKEQLDYLVHDKRTDLLKRELGIQDRPKF